MKSALKTTVTVIVLVAWGVYLWRNWRTLTEYDWSIDPLYLLLALLLAILYWLGLALCWQRTLRVSGGDLSMLSGVRIWVRSMFARYLPGNIWHILARLYMSEEEGMQQVTVLTSTAIEQVLTLVGALVIFGLSLPFMKTVVDGYLPMLFFVPLGLVAVHPFFLARGSALTAKLLGAPKILELKEYGRILLLLLGYILANAFAGTALWLVSLSMGSVSITQLPAVIGAFGAGWAAGYLSFFTPSGVGVREGILTVILTPVLGLPLATATSLLSRVLYTGGEVASLMVVSVSAKYLRTRSERIV